MSKEKMFSITIDNRKVEARSGLTILEAARENGIVIPSLCTLEPLPSFGACRLCVVEVDGLRGFPTSCTTPVEEGMVIRTDTAEIRSLRQEILKLLLSEHPGSCLFCDSQDQCKQYQGTIRKVGMTTGCRYCPNDLRCELQEVVQKVGLTETAYPVRYRNIPVEKYDPFYDRDYNLCVFCGRCVRACSSIRLNGCLAFKQRGKQTTIGPAFDRTHLEAGCEFCGSCISVCPTGALSAKTSKWYGKPDNQVTTTCTYCPVGCQIILQVKKNEVVDALPDYKSPIDHGMVCVKGRFAIPEYVNSPLRLSSPQKLTHGGYEEITWDEALAEAAEKLSAVSPDESLVMVSPQLTNEDLFVAQQFVRQALGSEAIASSVMTDLGEDLGPFLQLALSSDSFDAVDQAKAIFTIGFDATYGYSPIGVGVKKAVQAGAGLVTVGSLQSNLDILADVTLQLESSDWAALLELFIDGLPEKGKQKKPASKAGSGPLALLADDIENVSRLFADSPRNVMVVGPQVISAPERGEVFRSIMRLREFSSWTIILLHPYTNLLGMLVMGAFPGIKPGEIVAKTPAGTPSTIKSAAVEPDPGKRRKVLYLIGEVPANLPEHDYLIYQNALAAPAALKPNLILPAGLFVETEGSTVSSEGKVLPVRKAVEPYGQAKPDWWILSRIAEKMNKGKPKYSDVASIQAEIKKQAKVAPDVKKKLHFAKIDVLQREARGGGPGQAVASASDHAFRLYWKLDQDSYRGIPLAEVVSGMKKIGNRGYLLIHTEDAVKLGVAEEERVSVSCDGTSVEFPVRTSAAATPGTVHLVSIAHIPFAANPCAVQIRRNNE